MKTTTEENNTTSLMKKTTNHSILISNNNDNSAIKKIVKNSKKFNFSKENVSCTIPRIKIQIITSAIFKVLVLSSLINKKLEI